MTISFSRHPFLLSAQDVARELGTDTDRGLTAVQVRELSERFPANELHGGGAIPLHKILYRQVFNSMTMVRRPQSLLLCANSLNTAATVGSHDSHDCLDDLQRLD
jgi:hypothetical protein